MTQEGYHGAGHLRKYQWVWYSEALARRWRCLLYRDYQSRPVRTSGLAGEVSTSNRTDLVFPIEREALLAQQHPTERQNL